MGKLQIAGFGEVHTVAVAQTAHLAGDVRTPIGVAAALVDETCVRIDEAHAVHVGALADDIVHACARSLSASAACSAGRPNRRRDCPFEELHQPVDARAILAAPIVVLGFRATPPANAIAILRAEHDDGDVARIGAERLLQLSQIVGRAVAHQAGKIVALAGDRHAGSDSERLDETANQPFGKPVADDLHLIDVIIGERGDEAAAETLLLRGAGSARTSRSVMRTAERRARTKSTFPALAGRTKSGRRSGIVATASPKDKAET